MTQFGVGRWWRVVALVMCGLVVSGPSLEFNLNASALGYLAVEIQDEEGNPISGYTLKESLPIDRNRLAAASRWSSGRTMAELQGRTIRLHVTMRSCKLYAFQFTDASS